MKEEEMFLFFELINGIEIVGKLEPMGRELIKKGVSTLQQQNEHLETNWKELKKWGESLREYYKSMIGKYDYSDEDKVIKDMLDKMQELESRGNDE